MDTIERIERTLDTLRPYIASHRYAVFAKLSRIYLCATSGEGRWPVP